MSPRYRDAEMTVPTSVYRIFNRDGDLIYIGCATDVEHRIYMHSQNYATPMWDVISKGYHRHESVEYPTRELARAAERDAIATEAPWFNRHHNPKRWRRVANQWTPVEPDAMAAAMHAARPLAYPLP